MVNTLEKVLEITDLTGRQLDKLVELIEFVKYIKYEDVYMKIEVVKKYSDTLEVKDPFLFSKFIALDLKLTIGEYEFDILISNGYNLLTNIRACLDSLKQMIFKKFIEDNNLEIVNTILNKKG